MDTTHNHAENKLYGTQTQSNLSRAFDDKARSSVIYKLYAQKAHDDGLHGSARLFDELSENHLGHASLWYGYMDGISDTEENTGNALSLQNDLYDSYTDMAFTAENEGFYEIAEKMRLMQQVENSHKMRLSEMSDSLKHGYAEQEANTHWKCKTCGFETTGSHAPDRCPLCSYPKMYFEMTP